LIDVKRTRWLVAGDGAEVQSPSRGERSDRSSLSP
jgi:hypothetical protein